MSVFSFSPTLMFKRVLGIDKISRAQFNEDSDASDSDSDGDELTDKQRRRLQVVSSEWDRCIHLAYVSAL